MVAMCTLLLHCNKFNQITNNIYLTKLMKFNKASFFAALPIFLNLFGSTSKPATSTRKCVMICQDKPHNLVVISGKSIL